ncbi:MAG: hypothetical protein WKG07_04935 [Hymenobacter sp.]
MAAELARAGHASWLPPPQPWPPSSKTLAQQQAARRAAYAGPDPAAAEAEPAPATQAAGRSRPSQAEPPARPAAAGAGHRSKAPPSALQAQLAVHRAAWQHGPPPSAGRCPRRRRPCRCRRGPGAAPAPAEAERPGTSAARTTSPPRRHATAAWPTSPPSSSTMPRRGLTPRTRTAELTAQLEALLGRRRHFAATARGRQQPAGAKTMRPGSSWPRACANCSRASRKSSAGRT